MDDDELLSEYCRDGSEAAFTELVDRHMKLVYSTALRRVGGDSHLAKDVAQQVFSALARKASTLRKRGALVGWLYTSTRFAAADVVRSEKKRQAHELEAQSMSEPPGPGTSEMWHRVGPILEQVMGELDSRDQQAILLRYFEGRPFADIGRKLSLSENAARMRVERALDKMHALLSRHGIASTTAALASVLTSNAVSAVVPVGIAAEISGTALTAASNLGALSVLQSWAGSKVYVWMLAGSVGLGGMALLLQTKSNDELRDNLVSLTRLNENAAGELASSQKAIGSQTAALEHLGSLEAAAGRLSADTMSNEGDPPLLAMRVRSLIPRLYAPLLRKMRLDQTQRQSFEKLLLKKTMIEVEAAHDLSFSNMPNTGPKDISISDEVMAAATTEVDGEIHNLLGRNLYDEYTQYGETLRPRMEVTAFADQLRHSSTALRDEQADQLVVLLARAGGDSASPLPESLQSQVGSVFDTNQAEAKSRFEAVLQAHRVILARNRVAAESGKLNPPQPFGSDLILRY